MFKDINDMIAYVKKEDVKVIDLKVTDLKDHGEEYLLPVKN